jgi:KaiC/GvpD/RAD55 family RecA-like ATPase
MVTNPEGRFMMGFPDIDLVTRGFGKGHLIMVEGRSHSGKSQLMLNAIRNNPEARILWITPDEPSELVVLKLAAITFGLNADEIEKQLKSHDDTMLKRMRDELGEQYPNLVVYDQRMSVEEIWRAKQEAENHWSQRADLIVYDYLKQLKLNGGEGSNEEGKALAFKELSTRLDHPLCVIHQSRHGQASRGTPQGLEGGKGAVEDVATFVIEVYRKHENESLSAFERLRHKRTVSVNVCKNKVPPCRLRDVDLFIDGDTGFIRTWHEDDGAIRQLDELLTQRASRDGTVTWSEPELEGLMNEFPGAEVV